MIIKPLEVEVELSDRVRPHTIKVLCLSTWVNDKTIKVVLKGRMINPKISDPTIPHTKTMVLPNLHPKLLFALEAKDKVKLDLKVVNDPDKIKMKIKVRNKGREMYSASKVKCRNDERMRYPHPPRRFRWVKNRNKKDERMFPSSMLFQKYLPPPLFSFDGADDRLRNMITLKTFRNRGMR